MPGALATCHPASRWGLHGTLGELFEAVVTHREQHGRREGVWERERGCPPPHGTTEGRALCWQTQL